MAKISEIVIPRRPASQVAALWIVLGLLGLSMAILIFCNPGHRRGVVLAWPIGLAIGGVHQVLLAAHVWHGAKNTKTRPALR